LRNFQGHRVTFLRVLQDVDTGEDLRRVSQNRRNWVANSRIGDQIHRVVRRSGWDVPNGGGAG
jgi:hypothetical protein